MDVEKDSLYKVEEIFDVRYLLRKGSDCPIFEQLRELILRYKIWDFQEPDTDSQDSSKQSEPIEDYDDTFYGEYVKSVLNSYIPFL